MSDTISRSKVADKIKELKLSEEITTELLCFVYNMPSIEPEKTKCKLINKRRIDKEHDKFLWNCSNCLQNVTRNDYKCCPWCGSEFE